MKRLCVVFILFFIGACENPVHSIVKDADAVGSSDEQVTTDDIVADETATDETATDETATDEATTDEAATD